MLSSDQFRRLLAEIPLTKRNTASIPGYAVTKRLTSLTYLDQLERRINKIANRHSGM